MLFVTLLHWRLTDMQYIALLCAPMIISLIIILFQVKSFNDGILLVDSVMISPCAMCTSGTRHMPSSHCGHLLITTYSTMFCEYILHYLLLYYLEYIFLHWLPYCYILYFITFILPWYVSFLFYSPTCLSQARRGEGVIQDSYPGLVSMTEIWDLRDFRSIDQNSITEYWSHSHLFL